MKKSSGPSQTNFSASKLTKIWTIGKHLPAMKMEELTPWKIPEKTKGRLAYIRDEQKANPGMIHTLKAARCQTFSFSFLGKPRVSICSPKMHSVDIDKLSYYIHGIGGKPSVVEYKGKWYCVFAVHHIPNGLKKKKFDPTVPFSGRIIPKTDSVYILHEFDLNDAGMWNQKDTLDCIKNAYMSYLEQALAGDKSITVEEFGIDEYGYMDHRSFR